MAYRLEEVLLEQVPEDHGASMFNGEQVNDHIEQDDHTDNIVEYDGTNTLMMLTIYLTIYLFLIRHIMNPFMKAPK